MIRSVERDVTFKVYFLNDLYKADNFKIYDRLEIFSRAIFNLGIKSVAKRCYMSYTNTLGFIYILVSSYEFWTSTVSMTLYNSECSPKEIITMTLMNMISWRCKMSSVHNEARNLQ